MSLQDHTHRYFPPGAYRPGSLAFHSLQTAKVFSDGRATNLVGLTDLKVPFQKCSRIDLEKTSVDNINAI